MAQPLGPKSILIREAIIAHPDKGNTELAAFLNDADERMDDKFKITAQDVAAQKQAMKKSGTEPPVTTGNKRGRKPGQKAAVSPPPVQPKASANPDKGNISTAHS